MGEMAFACAIGEKLVVNTYLIQSSLFSICSNDSDLYSIKVFAVTMR